MDHQPFRYAIRILLLFAFSVSPRMVPAEITISKPPSDSRVFTPPAGSPLRRQILDALRLEVRQLLGIETRFVVDYLKVKDGWCWISARPQSPDGLQRYEGISALLHEDGDWKIEELPCAEPENPECLDAPDYFTGLLTRFPTIPQDILPASARTGNQ